jgi:hypothetical protein
MMIKCPNCSAEVEYIEGDCEICSECGSELKTVETPADSGRNLFANINFADIFKGKSTSDKPCTEEWDLSARSREIADNIDDMEFGEAEKSECPHLKVEYNHNLFFLTGSTSVIKLKLTPLNDQLQDLLIFMESERDGSHSRRQIPVREVLKKERAFFLQIPFAPEGTSGRTFLVFYIGCKINGSFAYYQFAVDHKVYDSRQSGSSLCSQITINQEFTSNHAADINYRDSIGDALKKMAEKTLSVNEMIDRLNDLPPKYRVQLLTKTTWRPEDVLIKGNLYPSDKLLLEYEGNTILLVNKNSVKLGRDPEQVDLLVRCGRGKMGAREYPNSTVSRKHAEILYCEDTVKLFDYSSYGTYINGRKPDNSGIPLELSATVEFGDIHWKMNIQKCNARLPHNICQTCSANKIKSVTFTRTDNEPEYYLLVWQCCELGRVIEDLMDWTIFSRNGCFFIRTPEQDFYHLRPGQTISSKEKQIKVKYFEQN